MKTFDDQRLAFISQQSGFRGLWLSKRNGRILWTVTYCDTDGEFSETEDCKTWRGAVDAFIGARNRRVTAGP